MSKRSIVLLLGIAAATVMSRASDASSIGGPVERPGIAPVVAEWKQLSEVVSGDGVPSTEVRTGFFYRDRFGRTRRDEGNAVTIDDPIRQVTILMDRDAKTFQEVTWARKVVAGQPKNFSVIRGTVNPEVRSLGTRSISGFEARGTEFSTPETQNTVQVWVSDDVQLPILSVAVNSTGGTTTETYENIVSVGDAPLPEALFGVPVEYEPQKALGKEIRPYLPPGGTPTCSTHVSPTYLGLVSYRFFGSYGSGSISAWTTCRALTAVVFVKQVGTPIDWYPTSASATSATILVYDDGSFAANGTYYADVTFNDSSGNIPDTQITLTVYN